MDEELPSPSTVVTSPHKTRALPDSRSSSEEDFGAMVYTLMTDHDNLVRLECNPQDVKVQTEPPDRRTSATQTSQDPEVASPKQLTIVTFWYQLLVFLDSPYRAKIDESFWSITFYLLAHAKFWNIIAAVLLCLPVYFFSYSDCLIHFTLVGLLFIQALENKHVSPMAADLYSLMAKYMRTPDEGSMQEILKFQARIRDLLQTYSVIEIVLCALIHYELSRRWDSIFCPHLYVCLAAPCLLELIATIGVYRQHYRSGGWEALRARFVF